MSNYVKFAGSWSFPVDKDFVLDSSLSIGAKMTYIAIKAHCAPGGDQAFPSSAYLAERLGVSRQTLLGYIRELEAAGLMTREQINDEGRFGRTVITLYPTDGKKTVNGKSDDGKLSTKEKTVGKEKTSTPKPPSKGAPARGSRQPSKEEIETASEIYEAYPKKVGRKNAISAIVKAIRAHDPREVLKATQAFSRATEQWPQSERRFIKHPQGWFNGEHFFDDQSLWVRETDVKQETHTIRSIEERMQQLVDKYHGFSEWSPEHKEEMKRLRAMKAQVGS